MTENDKTEWVTIRIPERVRKPAKDDPRTYGEIMADGLDESPGESIDVDTEAVVEEIKNDLSMVADPAVPEDDLVEDIAERVETMEGTVKEQTQTIQTLQKTLEDMR